MNISPDSFDPRFHTYDRHLQHVNNPNVQSNAFTRRVVAKELTKRHIPDEKSLPLPEQPEPETQEVHEPLPYEPLTNSERSEAEKPELVSFKVKQPREKLEDIIRRAKRARQACPFVGPHGECQRPEIRCGERLQFSAREDSEHHKLPHRCLYNPYFPSDHIVIIEPDPILREFCIDSLRLFFKYDMNKVAICETAEQAFDTINHFKLQDRQIGLVIINSSLPGTSGYDLINDLYVRNVNCEILVLCNFNMEELKEYPYSSIPELSPGIPFISAYLQTPFHTEHLIDTIKRLHFGKFL